jgi:hypothetical protein
MLMLIGLVISTHTFALAIVSLYIITTVLMLWIAVYCSFVKGQRSALFFWLHHQHFWLGVSLAG